MAKLTKRQRHKSNRFRLGVALLALVIVGLIVAAYLQRTQLLDRLTAEAASRLDLDSLSIDAERLTGDGAAADSIAFKKHLDWGEIEVRADDVQLGFSVFPLVFSNVRITKLKVDVNIRPAASTGAMAPTVSLPRTIELPAWMGSVSTLTVDALDATLTQLADVVRVDGSAVFRRDSDKLSARIQQTSQRLEAEYNIGDDRLALFIYGGDDKPVDAAAIAEAEVQGLRRDNPGVDVGFELTRLVDWARRSPWLYERWRATIPSFDVASADIRVTGVVPSVKNLLAPRSLSAKANWRGLALGDCRVDGDIDVVLEVSPDALAAQNAIVRFEQPGRVRVANCAIAAGYPGATGTLDVAPEKGFSVSFDRAVAGFDRIDARGPFTAVVESNEDKIELNVRDFDAKNLLADGGLPEQITARVTSSVTFQRVAIDQMKILRTEALDVVARAVEGRFDAFIAKNGDAVSVDLQDNATLGLGGIDINQADSALKLGATELEAIGSAAIRVDPEGRPQISKLDARVTLGIDELRQKLGGGGVGASARDFSGRATLTGAKDEVTAEFEYDATDFALTQPNLSAAAVSGGSTLQFADTVDGSIRFILEGVRSEQIEPALSAKHVETIVELRSGKTFAATEITLADDVVLELSQTPLDIANLEFTLPFRLDTDAGSLLDWATPSLSPRLPPIEIDAGRVLVAGELRLVDGNELSAELAIDDLAGAVAEIAFEGLSLRLDSTNVIERKAAGRLSIAAGESANGLTFAGLSVSADFDGDSVVLRDLNIDALGANIGFDVMEFDAKDFDADTVVSVSGLDVANFLDFIFGDRVVATGQVDGQLPVRMTPTHTTISDARLTSTQAGVIQYNHSTSGNGTSANGVDAAPAGPALDNIAIEALKNFHYEKLSIVLNYDEDGEYRANLRIEGSNPDVYDGYPIALNLNINGVLPGLLRTSVLGGQFDEEVLKEYRRQDR